MVWTAHVSGHAIAKTAPERDSSLCCSTRLGRDCSCFLDIRLPHLVHVVLSQIADAKIVALSLRQSGARTPSRHVKSRADENGVINFRPSGLAFWIATAISKASWLLISWLAQSLRKTPTVSSTTHPRF